jgi:anti-sigma factor RsiW
MRNDELIRLSMKPELSPDDAARLEAFLAAHPAERAAWEEERALGRALQSLPDVPVSSNFTAQVMQSLDLEEARDRRADRRRSDWWRTLWPRLSWGAAAIVLAVFGVQQYQAMQRNNQLVQDVAFVSKDMARLPDAFRDFELIESLRQIPPSGDDGILIALQ